MAWEELLLTGLHWKLLAEYQREMGRGKGSLKGSAGKQSSAKALVGHALSHTCCACALHAWLHKSSKMQKKQCNK